MDNENFRHGRVAVFREKGRGNGEWREASLKEDVSIRKGGNAPPVHSARE